MFGFSGGSCGNDVDISSGKCRFLFGMLGTANDQWQRRFVYHLPMGAVAAWSEWAWWTAGWGLAALACLLLLWAVAGDRRRRAARRCAGCWYDMAGLGLVCPECGRIAVDESELRRRRRRWRWSGAAFVLAVIAMQVAAQPRRAGEGWTRAAPTTMLVLLARPPGQSGPINAAIAARPHANWQLALAEWMTLRVGTREVAGWARMREKWPADTVGHVVISSEALRTDFGWMSSRPGGRSGGSGR